MEISFGSYLRNLIERKGVTYTDLHKRSKLSRRQIKRMEHGEQQPTIKSLNKLKIGLQLTQEELKILHDLANQSRSQHLFNPLQQEETKAYA
jgi:transcriptional regulator with XRE-family HTH domain